MKFLTKTITVLAEMAAIILSIIWYINAKEIEPLIGIILSGTALLVSLMAKFANRPRIALHHK